MTTATPTIDVVLQGYAFLTNQGHVGFCGVSLIEGPDADGRLTRILVDPAHVGRRPFLWEALAARNLGPRDIDLVVLTHTHFDHMQNFDVFGHAPLLLHPDERLYAHHPHVNDSATPGWTGLILETADIREVSEGDQIIPGVGVVDLPGHSPGSIGLTVETAEGLAVITGDAVQNSRVALTKVNPMVFWGVEAATRSVEKAVALGEVFYPGHDQVFRLARAGEVEYLTKRDITLIGLTEDMPGVELVGPGPRPPFVMPGVEEQPSRLAEFRQEADRRRHDALEAGFEPDRPVPVGPAPVHDHPH